jgi:hypothetical protein
MNDKQPKKRGRPPLGERAMTKAERQAKSVAKAKSSGLKPFTVFIPSEVIEEMDRTAEFYGLKDRAELMNDLLAFSFKHIVMDPDAVFEREYLKATIEHSGDVIGDPDGKKVRAILKKFWKAVMLPTLEAEAVVTSEGAAKLVKQLTGRGGDGQ